MRRFKSHRIIKIHYFQNSTIRNNNNLVNCSHTWLNSHPVPFPTFCPVCMSVASCFLSIAILLSPLANGRGIRLLNRAMLYFLWLSLLIMPHMPLWKWLSCGPRLIMCIKNMLIINNYPRSWISYKSSINIWQIMYSPFLLNTPTSTRALMANYP